VTHVKSNSFSPKYVISKRHDESQCNISKVKASQFAPEFFINSPREHLPTPVNDSEKPVALKNFMVKKKKLQRKPGGVSITSKAVINDCRSFLFDGIQLPITNELSTLE
jgi:hypothetical protein